MFPIEEFPIVTIPDVCTVFNVLFNKIVFVIRFVLPVTVLLIIVLLDDGEKWLLFNRTLFLYVLLYVGTPEDEEPLPLSSGVPLPHCIVIPIPLLYSMVLFSTRLWQPLIVIP